MQARMAHLENGERRECVPCHTSLPPSRATQVLMASLKLGSSNIYCLEGFLSLLSLLVPPGFLVGASLVPPWFLLVSSLIPSCSPWVLFGSLVFPSWFPFGSALDRSWLLCSSLLVFSWFLLVLLCCCSFGFCLLCLSVFLCWFHVLVSFVGFMCWFP